MAPNAKLLLPILPFFLSCSGTPATRVTPTPGNVLIVVSDALRPDVLGCYGGAARTPNIDWLAANGVLMETAYANSPWTAPSSVSLLTGKYATTYTCEPVGGSVQINVPDGELLFAEVLRELGYTTLANVENVNALMHNAVQGMEPPAKADYRNVKSSKTRRALEEMIGRELTGPSEYQQLYDALARLTLLDRGERFMLLYWMTDPHAPYNPPERFLSRIEFDTSLLPEEPATYQHTVKSPPELSEVEAEYLKRLYMADVESVDERVGFMLDVLRQTGRLADTYIVFTSDHGEQLGERGQWGHGAWGENSNYYEPAVRIPMIVLGPNLPKGARRTAPVSLVDVMPTLKELLGADYRSDMQGRSFAALLLGETSAERSVFLTDVREHDQRDALRRGRYKLISLGDEVFELYDVESDPHEETNLAAEEPRVAESMRRAIEEQQEDNARRREEVASEPPDRLSEEELKKTIKELEALGYVK